MNYESETPVIYNRRNKLLNQINDIFTPLSFGEYGDLDKFINSFHADDKSIAQRAIEFNYNALMNKIYNESRALLTRNWNLSESMEFLGNFYTEGNNSNTQFINKSIILELKKWYKEINSVDIFRSIIVSKSEYGKKNTDFFKMMEKNADYYNSKLNLLYEEKNRLNHTKEDVLKLPLFSYNLIVIILWYYAYKEPHEANNYQKALELYNELYLGPSFDSFSLLGIEGVVAEVYIAKKMGYELDKKTDSLIDGYIDLCLKNNGPVLCEVLASALMAMGCFEYEKKVLSILAKERMQMNNVVQERLKILNTGLHSAVIHNSNSTKYAFDISWKELNSNDFQIKLNEYVITGNSIQNFICTDLWSKSITLAQNSEMRSINDVLNKVADDINNGFKGDIQSSIIEAAIVSLNESKMTGVLFNFDTYKHMSMFFHITKIGRRISLNIYTLFNPIIKNVNKQAEQLMSVKNMYNPDMSAYREALQSAIQDILTTILESAINIDGNVNNDFDTITEL